MSKQYQAIVVKVPIEDLFRFYRLMKEHSFESAMLWSFSDWPDEFKEPPKPHYPGPTR